MNMPIDEHFYHECPVCRVAATESFNCFTPFGKNVHERWCLACKRRWFERMKNNAPETLSQPTIRRR
jgi:hypothetical protein